jgi:hypothetical protein
MKNPHADGAHRCVIRVLPREPARPCLRSRHSIAKVIRPPARMRHRDNNSTFFLHDECDIVREARQVHPPVTTSSQSPKQRMLDNRSAHTLDFRTKSHTEPLGSGLIVARDAFRFSERFWKKLQDKTHCSGAICLNLANASPAGIGLDSPDLKRSIRWAISASQAASAPGSGSRSTLSSN